MAYPFVQAFYDYGHRTGPTLAFAIHMAEGGGTVGFLSRESVRGVSVHYVIERSGRIVQMLREDRASGSINPNDIRTTDGPAPYGATVRKQVMGSWDRNPNQAILSVEIEGFAKDGPNADQNAALRRLVADIRTRYPRIGLLGHRDWADYKACPGAKIPWDALGGHGPYQGDDAVKAFKSTLQPAIGTVAKGVWLYDSSDLTASSANVQVDPGRDFPYLGFLTNSKGESVRIVVNDNAVAMFTLAANVTNIRAATTPSDPTEQPVVLAPGLYEVLA